MILQIDENYRIRTDEHNFMLEKRRKERWFALCYCQTLDHVLESVRDEKIKNLGKPHSGGLIESPARPHTGNQGHWRAMREPVGQGELDPAICWAYYLETR